MRKLLVARGAPGSGKSTWLRELGMSHNTLSSDVVRGLYASPVLLPDGRMAVDQSQSREAFALINSLLSQRMAKGETLALDSTFVDGQWDTMLRLAREHGYQVACLDASTVPLEQCLERNAKRGELDRVPEGTVERMHGVLAMSDIPGAVHRIEWQDDGSHVQAARNWLAAPHIDASDYRKIVFVGDLQGCWSVIEGPGGLLESGLDTDTLYVFCGDLVDRGVENDRVVAAFHEMITQNDNVVLIFGNHETHLYRWSRGLPGFSREFNEQTLPQLQAAGITPAMAGAIVDRSLECATIHWRGQDILVTHAGLPTVPERLDLVDSYTLTHGTGHYSDPVDEQFARTGPAGWVQVHGHRNHAERQVRASENSFNLEGGVEHGGSLRWAALDGHGWKWGEIQNRVFRSLRERIQAGSRIWSSEIVAPWMHAPRDTRMDDGVIEAMREHSGVREDKAMEGNDRLLAFNFSKRVFFEKSWDDVAVKARGLFVDAQTHEIVARGYEKFFNVGERPDTTIQALRETLQFPIKLYVKENGYLGNLGYDEASDALMIASKSRASGPFAQWFGEILREQVGEDGLVKWKRWLRDNEACATFEVIDPVRDPHMVEYDKASVVLLDVFHRSTKMQRLDHETLKRVAGQMGVAVKEQGLHFPNAHALEGWLRSCEGRLDWRHRGRDIEGFVIEDASGYMTKVKMPHYAFWKRMRGAMQRIIRLREKIETGGAQEADRARHDLQGSLDRNSHPLARAFVQWCIDKDIASIKGADIITARKQFMDDVAPDPQWLTVPWIEYPEQALSHTPKPARTRSPMRSK